jgi:NitT/TauT family transport system permease protein
VGIYRKWQPWIFPAPSHVLDAALQLLNFQSGFGEPLHKGWPAALSEPGVAAPHLDPWWSSPLLKAVAVSGVRLLEGFVFTVIIGTVFGLMMWRWIEFDRFIGPVFLGLQTLPSVCWIPLAILCFGINEQAILFVLVMGSFSAIALVLRDGLRMIPPLYPRAGMMLGAKGWRLYFYVLLPASLPALAGSLRTGFSFAWRSLMGAELIFVGVKWRGVGFLLQTGRDFSDVAQVVAAMAIMVIIGILADRWLFAILQRRVQTRFGLAAS